MKLTLDRMCIQTKNLCKACQTAMDKGEISEFDMELGLILMNLAKSNKYLNDLTILNIVETSNNVFIMVKKGQIEKMEKAHDQIIEQLGSLEKRKLYYFEKTKSSKTLVNMLLHPIKPISSTTIILPPDGQKEIKLKFKSKYKSEIPLPAIELSKLTSAILNMETHYIFV